MQHSANDIDAMILEEKRISATECHDEAWAAGLLAGIEPEIIAETAVMVSSRSPVWSAVSDSPVHRRASSGVR